MKTYLAGLQSGTVGSTYNSAQWSALGRISSKSINSSTVYGPALTAFIDTQTQQGFAPDFISMVPTQNLLFAIGAISATPSVYAYNFNYTTGVYSYIGKVVMGLTNTPAQTHVIKDFWAWSDGTNVRIGLATTATTNQQFGCFVTYAALSAFTTGGTNCYQATATGQTNATYFLQPGDYYGLTYNTTTQAALGFEYCYLSSSAGVQTKAVLLDATAAAPRYLVWDLNSNPSVAGTVLNGVNSSATSYTGTNPAAFFTMSAQNGYNTTVPIAGAMENIILMNGTGAAPTVAGVSVYTGGAFMSTANANTAAMRDLQQQYTLGLSSSVTVASGTTVTINGVVWNIVTTQTSVTSVVITSPAGYTGYANALPTTGSYTTSGAVALTVTSVTAGNWFFNVSVPATLTALTPTAATNFTIMRANGVSTNTFYGRTPVTGFTPALTGATVAGGMLSYCKPLSTPALTSLQGADCLAVTTTTGLQMQKFSDLFQSVTATVTANSTTITFSTAQSMQNGSAVFGPGVPAGATIVGATSNSTTAVLSAAAYASPGSSTYVIGNQSMATWTSVNITGTGIDVVAPTLAAGTYSSYSSAMSGNDVDKFVYATNTSTFVMKQLQSSVALAEVFGGVVVSYLEGNNPVNVQFGVATAPTNLECKNGWLAMASFSQVGQRGIIVMDALSHNDFGYSALISPVLSLPNGLPGAVLHYIDTLEQLFDYTDSSSFWIRSAATAGNAIFSTASIPVGSSGPTSNGWTLLRTAMEETSISIGPYFQICQTPQVLTFDANTPSQIQDLAYTISPANEISDYWVGSVNNTTQNGASPAYTAFMLSQAYTGSVPTLYFRAYDENGNLVASANTSSNPTSFQYTTNNGTSWTALGTIPNTINTTEVRYVWTTPPGVPVICSLRES